MSTADGWKPTLRYSPVNGVIVDWGIGNEPFCMGCLPQPKCKGPEPEPEGGHCCSPEPIIETVDTYDWFRWTPEIEVGHRDAITEMAATYARRAAIEFADKTRVLKRQIAIRLQPGVYRYPLEPFTEENIKGITKIESAYGLCSCECNHNAPVNLGYVRINKAKQELIIQPQGHGCCGWHIRANNGPEHILVTVWSAPTEDACNHDVFLYDHYRAEITKGARAMFILEAHSEGNYVQRNGMSSYRGDQMVIMQQERYLKEFRASFSKVRAEADLEGAIMTGQHMPAGQLFHAGGGCSSSVWRRW